MFESWTALAPQLPPSTLVLKIPDGTELWKEREEGNRVD